MTGDEEYSAICVDFEEAGLRVIKLERLQNHIQLDKFKTEKEHLLRQRHTGKLYLCENISGNI